MQLAGSDMTGQLGLPGGGGATEALQKQEVETLITEAFDGASFDDYVEVAGDNMTGDLTFDTDKITLGVDGSAEFAGRVDISGTDNANHGIAAKNNSTAQGTLFLQNAGNAAAPSPLIQGFDGGLAKKVEIFNNGSVELAGGAFTIDSDGVSKAAQMLISGTSAYLQIDRNIAPSSSSILI